MILVCCLKYFFFLFVIKFDVVIGCGIVLLFIFIKKICCLLLILVKFIVLIFIWFNVCGIIINFNCFKLILNIFKKCFIDIGLFLNIRIKLLRI